MIGPDLDPHFVISVLEYLVAAYFLIPKESQLQLQLQKEVFSDAVMVSRDVVVEIADNKTPENASSTKSDKQDTSKDLPNTSDTLEQSRVTEELLKFISGKGTVTGHNIHVPHYIANAVLQHLVNEKDLVGFGNPDFYHRVEEYLTSLE